MVNNERNREMNRESDGWWAVKSGNEFLSVQWFPVRPTIFDFHICLSSSVDYDYEVVPVVVTEE
jgi:hypothetical protein